MAPVRRGTAVVSSNTSVVASFLINAPTGIADNDVWEVAIELQAAGVTVATPAGWNLLVDSTEDAQGSRLYVFWRYWHTGDATSQTFTFSGAGSAYGAVSNAYLNCEQSSNPYGTPQIASDQTNDATLDVAALTTVGSDSLSIVFSGHQSASTTITATNGYSEVGQTGGKRVQVADQTRAAPTVIAALTFTLSAASRGHTAHVELRSAASGGSASITRIPNPNVGPMALRHRFRRVLVYPSAPGATQQTLTLSGTVTPVGSIVKQAQKPVAGIVTPAGAIANQAKKILAGAITAAGTLVKQVSKLVTGSATPTGTLSNQAQKTLAGGTTPSGSLVKLATKFLSGTLISAGAAVIRSVKLLSVSGGITPSGALVKQTQKPLTGATTPSGTLRRVTGKTISGVIAPTGSLVKLATKILAGTLTSAGSLVIRGVKLLVIGGGITPSGTLVKQTQKPLSGTTTPAGAIRKTAARILTGTITPAGTLAKQARKAFTGTVTATGTLLRTLVQIGLAVITTRTRTSPGSGLTRAAGGSGATRSSPTDGLTNTDGTTGLTHTAGDDGETTSSLGG